MNHGQGRPLGSPNKGKSWRRLVRIEKAALLTLKGFPNDMIAAHIGIHTQTLVYLKQTPEFKARMLALQTGVVETHNRQVLEDEEYQREQLRSMVPIALQKLQELAMSANQHIAYKASQDILDREGTHAKVSRTAIDIKEQVNLSVINQVAASIQDVLTAMPRPIEAESQNKNNQHQEDIEAEFTKGATDSTSQLYQMEETLNKPPEDNPEKRIKVN
jgi:hypothetical protein